MCPSFPCRRQAYARTAYTQFQSPLACCWCRHDAVRRQQEQDEVADCTFSPRTNHAKNAALLNAPSWPPGLEPFYLSRVSSSRGAASTQAHSSSPRSLDSRLPSPRRPQVLPVGGAASAAYSPLASPGEDSTICAPHPPAASRRHWDSLQDPASAAGERMYRGALHSLRRREQCSRRAIQVLPGISALAVQSCVDLPEPQFSFVASTNRIIHDVHCVARPGADRVHACEH